MTRRLHLCGAVHCAVVFLDNLRQEIDVLVRIFGCHSVVQFFLESSDEPLDNYRFALVMCAVHFDISVEPPILKSIVVELLSFVDPDFAWLSVVFD